MMRYSNNSNNNLDAIAGIAICLTIFNTILGLFNYSENLKSVQTQKNINKKIDKLIDEE